MLPLALDAFDLGRVVLSLAQEELSRSRGNVTLPPLEADGSLPALEPDSLELLNLAAATARLFRLDELGVEDQLLRDPTLRRWPGWIAQALDHGTGGLSFATSGSTGIPKLCQHAWTALAQEVAFLAGLFADVERVVTLVPCHHIYGFLWTVALPRALGVRVVDGRSALSTRRLLAAGDLLVAFPLRWQQLAADQQPLVGNLTGVTSTAPCDPVVIRRLKALGLARLVEVYGSSETGALGYREDPDRSYRLLPYWHPLADGLQRQHSDGGVETYPPPDYLEWTAPEQFLPRGRRDGAVQVGGVNVFPTRVAQLLGEHPGVADCQVRLMAPGEGDRLKAFVVPADPLADLPALEATLTRWLRQRLSAPELPTRITFGHQLPRNELGKLADWP